MEAGFCPEGQYGEVRLREIYETKDGKGGFFFFFKSWRRVVQIAVGTYLVPPH